MKSILLVWMHILATGQNGMMAQPVDGMSCADARDLIGTDFGDGARVESRCVTDAEAIQAFERARCTVLNVEAVTGKVTATCKDGPQ